MRKVDGDRSRPSDYCSAHRIPFGDRLILAVVSTDRRMETKVHFLISVSLMFVAAAAIAQSTASVQPLTLRIWPGNAPGETTANTGRVSSDPGASVTALTDITEPQMIVYKLAGKAKRPAVLVCPGGGYYILASDLVGSEIAQWLNKLGYVSAVLHYRVPNNREGALQDAQRALSILRSRADEFGIDSRHLGALGFSAGGHLCARLADESGTRVYAPIDDADKQSCRPDFVLLIYPAYLTDPATKAVSPEVLPHAGMPPIFLVQTKDDPYLDAPEYAASLTQAGISAKLELYDKGGHGYGLRAPTDEAVHSWPDEAAKWIAQQVSGGST